MATIAISAATPIKTPSMVRAERSLLRAKACNDAKKIIDRKAVRKPDSAAEERRRQSHPVGARSASRSA